MRIAFVSDIHGNLTALDAVIADIERRGVDEVVNLGDTVSGPLLPLETARRLHPLPWLHVAGNHERQVLRLPLGRQNASDAYTTGQLADADKASPHYVKGVSCAHCHDQRSPQEKAALAERQRQVELAEQRGQQHVGARMPEREGG